MPRIRQLSPPLAGLTVTKTVDASESKDFVTNASTMEIIQSLLGIILHLDKHLTTLSANYGPWMYTILFLIVFAETGLVVTPFLPGDSLLFAVGALCASGSLNIIVMIALLIIAAIAGDTVNYMVGHRLGLKPFEKRKSRIFKREYLEKTERFYEKYGGKTIIIARFVPIVRTFAPFIAGVGSMKYSTFLYYNIVGALLWIISLTLAGYFFGNIEIVKKNFSLVVIGIIILSILPAIIEYISHKRQSKQ